MNQSHVTLVRFNGRGVECSCLVVIGSMVSTISHPFLNSCEPVQKLKNLSNFCLTGANNGPFHIWVIHCFNCQFHLFLILQWLFQFSSTRYWAFQACTTSHWNHCFDIFKKTSSLVWTEALPALLRALCSCPLSRIQDYRAATFWISGDLREIMECR